MSAVQQQEVAQQFPVVQPQGVLQGVVQQFPIFQQQGCVEHFPVFEQKAGVELQVKLQDLKKNQLDMFDKQVTIEGKQIDNAKKVNDEYRQDMQMMQSSII